MPDTIPTYKANTTVGDARCDELELLEDSIDAMEAAHP